MTLLIKPKAQPKPTTLQEKQSGFKFQAPKLQPKTEQVVHEVVDKPNTTSTNKPDVKKAGLIPLPNKPNANNLLIGKPKTGLLNQNTKSVSSPIPEMSNDKYEVVADSVAEFSEEAGNKFQEQLDMLQQAVDGTGELKDQMVNILTFLDDNPQYKANVSPKDVSVFVAACRKVAGITVQEKAKRKTSTAKVSAKVEEVMGDLADLEFTL